MHLLLLLRNIHKPGQFRFPAKIYGSDRAVTLFRDNNLRRVRVIRILIIIIVTVQEHHNVGILLDGSGLSMFLYFSLMAQELLKLMIMKRLWSLKQVTVSL